MQPGHRSILIIEKSSVGEARRAALSVATSLGFDEQSRSNIGIVVTEAVTNIALHAGEGELLICPFSEGETAWLDLIALDKGPGISDLGRAAEDGFSTTGTAGNGLGAIERLSDDSSFYSVPGKGTACWSRFSFGEPVNAQRTGLVNIPVKGETECGDSFFMDLKPDRSLYMMVDGLGHGPGAREAALAAVAAVKRSISASPGELLQQSHGALKATRGAAMSVALVDPVRKLVTYSGVGNITGGLVLETQVRTMISQNGTVGATMPRTVQEYTYPFETGTILTMFSDGLTTRAGFQGYPGVMNRPAALMAGILYRDFSRGRDDVTALVARIGVAPK